MGKTTAERPFFREKFMEAFKDEVNAMVDHGNLDKRKSLSAAQI